MDIGRVGVGFRQSRIAAAMAWLWSIFVSLVVVVGVVAILYFVGGRDIALWTSSYTWQPAQCEILKATYDRKETSEAGSTSVKISWRTVVKYQFRDDYGHYTGNRYDFSLWRTSLSKVRKNHAHLSSSKYIPCYYNSRNPQQSVISRKFPADLLWTLVPLLSLGPFAYMAFMNILSKLRRPKKVKRFLP